MTRGELVLALAEREGLTKERARLVVDTFFSSVEEGLVSGFRVELRGFGTLRARFYPSYEGRNPESGARVRVRAKVVPVYRAGAGLLKRLRGSDGR